MMTQRLIQNLKSIPKKQLPWLKASEQPLRKGSHAINWLRCQISSGRRVLALRGNIKCVDWNSDVRTKRRRNWKIDTYQHQYAEGKKLLRGGNDELPLRRRPPRRRPPLCAKMTQLRRAIAILLRCCPLFVLRMRNPPTVMDPHHSISRSTDSFFGRK